jgi:hypothetical protein
METKQTNDLNTLTLRQKLARIRVEFSKSNIKKSGENKYAGFKYFELCDIVPKALELFEKYDVTLDFSMNETDVNGVLYDNVKDYNPIVFRFPRKGIDDPKAMRMNTVQAMGSEITYYRRYIYNIVLDIVENDSFDCLDNTQKQKQNTNKPKQNAPKPSQNTAQPVANDTKAQVTPEQSKVLITSVSQLIKKMPEYKDEMEKVSNETNRFTKMTQEYYKELLTGVQTLLNGETK